MDQRLETIVAELREQLEALYGERLKRLVLFGSHARGDAEPGSDVDVLVVLEGTINSWEEIQRTSDVRVDLCLKYEVVVSCVYVTEDSYNREKSPLLLNVRREGLAI